MSDTRTIEQQKTLERLARAVTLQGWKDVEIFLAFDELMIDRHREGAACTVVMRREEPTFQAHFAVSTVFSGAIAFSIGEADEAKVQDGARKFPGVHEAAQWLLSFLRNA